MDIDIRPARQEVVEQLDINIHPPPIYRIVDPVFCAKWHAHWRQSALFDGTIAAVNWDGEKGAYFTSSRQFTIFDVTFPYPRSEYFVDLFTLP